MPPLPQHLLLARALPAPPLARALAPPFLARALPPLLLSRKRAGRRQRLAREAQPG